MNECPSSMWYIGPVVLHCRSVTVVSLYLGGLSKQYIYILIPVKLTHTLQYSEIKLTISVNTCLGGNH